MKSSVRPILHGILLTGLLVLIWYLFDAGCVVRRITGFPCPGCGLTRGLIAALGGDLAGAFRMHPLFWLPPLILLAIVLLARFKPDYLDIKRARWFILAFGIIYFGVYIVRMILFFPDQEPLTYDRTSWFSIFSELGSWLLP